MPSEAIERTKCIDTKIQIVGRKFIGTILLMAPNNVILPINRVATKIPLDYLYKLYNLVSRV